MATKLGRSFLSTFPICQMGSALRWICEPIRIRSGCTPKRINIDGRLEARQGSASTLRGGRSA